MALPIQQDQAALYQYRALETQRTFRLLRLHAGQGHRISCSLHHYDLGSAACPSYRAISYTWDKDTARYSIHLADGSVIKIRKNLRNALRSVRDEDSDCWLWIDAICINQQSNQERNHQVKLMADVYGMANVVLVWLQSAGESADVAKAFKFVHAAATYGNSTAEESVYRYTKAHPRDNEDNWRSVKRLCKLRYWTRKWVIQELVSARSVVLQAGSAECSMADFELFCRQLHRNRDNNAYRRLSSTRREIWKHVAASPAARLALQRSEREGEQQPRLLHKLIDRYASNQCGLPCDHVYALYSLVGEHRSHLSIDYAATPLQRFVAVLRFVHTHERLQPAKVMEFADLLMRLFEIEQEDVRREYRLLENLNVVVPSTILGTVQLQPESEASIGLRGIVEPLHPMPTVWLDTSQDTWVLAAIEGPNDPYGRVGRPDMTYFGITESGFHGLAACRLEEGDSIWHFPGTQIVFAVRRVVGHGALVVGRAYLFSAARNNNGHLEPWLRQPFDYNTVRQGEQHISLHWATLLELSSLAKDVKMGLKTPANASWSLKSWKKQWLYQVVIAGSTLIFVLQLAAMITQVLERQHYDLRANG